VVVSLLGALTVPVRAARACGPDFPPQLLADRAGRLSGMPESTFLFEASRLVPRPPDTFAVVEGAEPEGARRGGGPEETARYEAGARLFQETRPDEAAKRFGEVLALPAEQRARFSTFAAFMLGRLTSMPESATHFAQVRELVRQGFDDPLGLAVASLGEEARERWDRGEDAEAIRLYAQQAAYGSDSGRASLLLVARALMRDEPRMRRALAEPLAQRLLATYAWTRGHEEMWTEDLSSFTHPPLATLLEALAAVPNLAGADRLAAAAWREGRFDVAERFAGRERTPVDAWVRAKLAARRGDRAEAERCLAEAREGFPADEDWETNPILPRLRPRTYVEAERSLLALLRDDFTGAAERALGSCSWPDLAYVVEHVLSVEELQRFVAAHAADPALRCRPEPAYYQEDAQLAPTVGEQLRPLLARRLMREGRGAEAVDAFRGTPWEEPARRYVEALERARSAWKDVDKAQALFTAARLARKSGMELLGTETAPDWSWVQGEFELETSDASELMSPAERERLKASGPAHPTRFHYRATAADLAEKAATLVPPRSQAYAALLCHAARFIHSREPERAERLWDTYVKNGAWIPSLPDSWFAESCPEPDFERAHGQLTFSWPRPGSGTLATLGGGLLMPLVGLAVLRRRRRERAPQDAR
jgi:hypothetical protein